MFDIVYVVKICNIPLPEEPAKDDLFMTQFRTWVLLKELKVFNPERVVKYFIETLSTNNAKAFMKRQQEPLFVFLCLDLQPLRVRFQIVSLHTLMDARLI